MANVRRLLNLMASVGLAACIYGCQSVDETAVKRERMKQMMRTQEFQLTEPIVAYCRASTPEAATTLEAGYANYVIQIQAAYDSWINQLGDAELSGAPTPGELQEMAQKITELSEQMLASVRQRDPHIYCPWLAERLGAYTPESAKKTVANAQAKLKAARDAKRR